MTQDDSSEEQQETRRPRVVDRRISARGQGSQTQPAAEPVGSEPAEVAPPSEPEPGEPEAPVAETPQREATTASAGQQQASEVWTPEQQEAAEKIAQQIRETPTESWVLNVAMTLIDVAGVKLDAGDAAGASLAIDALAGLSREVSPKLGEAGTALNRALADLRMAFAERVSGPPQGPQP